MQYNFFIIKTAVRNLELYSIFFTFLICLFCSPFTKTAKFIYVIFHEMSHIIPALLLKVEIKKIHISMESGFVECSKDNFWSRIFPYAVPLLPCMLLLLYGGNLFLYQIYFPQPCPIWIHHLFKGTILWSIALTTFWNGRLLWIGTPDIPEKNKWIALLIITHSYTICVAFLLFWITKK